MNGSVREALNAVHPRSLRVGAKEVPQEMGIRDFRKEIGQAFEWALDRAHMNQKTAAELMGYSDPAVIGRWCNGSENVQVHKVWLCGELVFGEFVCALAQLTSGVQIRTVIEMVRRFA
jgi:hypothetical protein